MPSDVAIRLRVIGQRMFGRDMKRSSRDVDQFSASAVRARSALLAEERAAMRAARALRRHRAGSMQARAATIAHERAQLAARRAVEGHHRALAGQRLQFTRTRSAAGFLAGGVGRLGTSFAGAARTAGKLTLAATGLAGVIGVAGLVRAARSGISSMISLNAQWQTLNTQFATLIGDPDKAAAWAAWVETMRDVTSASPLRLTEALDGARGLIAAGMRLDRVRDTVVAMQNASLVGREDPATNYARIAEILGVIQARGKISAEELNRFDDAGISVRKILQRELGLTADEVAEIGKQGISARRAINALIRAWTGGSMREAVRRAEGTWMVQTASARKKWEQLQRLTGEGLFRQLNKREMPTLLRSLDRAIDVVQGRRGRGTLVQRLRFVWRGTKRDWEPTVRDLEDLLRRAKVGERLEEAIDKGTPIVARAAGRAFATAAPRAGEAFFEGWKALPLWAKVLTGGWLVNKFAGGGGAWLTLGSKAGGFVLDGLRKKWAGRAASIALAGGLDTAIVAAPGRFEKRGRRIGRIMGRAAGPAFAAAFAVPVAVEFWERVVKGPDEGGGGILGDTWNRLTNFARRPTGRATGGTVKPGEITLLGERGPELVRLPAGSRVTPARQTREMLSGRRAAAALTINSNLFLDGHVVARNQERVRDDSAQWERRP